MKKLFIALCLLLALCAPAKGETGEEACLKDALANGELIRLHILARDDTREAQALKLAVRDAVLRAFSETMCGDSADALYAELQQNAESMRLVAETTLRALGCADDVAAEVGVMTLPEKRYGDVLLPEGDYRALRLTLGSGEGRNWWCILFPSLCLATATEEPWQTGGVWTWDAGRVLENWLLWS